MTPKNVAIESPELLERAAKEAEQSGQTLDELTALALERELARRSFVRLRREAQVRRGTMSGQEVEETVDRGVQEYRSEQRRR